MPLSLCEHIYHGECLETYVKTSISDGKLPLVCPDTTCAKEIADSDLRSLLKIWDFAKYESLALDKAIGQKKDMSWCPTPDCTYAFVFVDGDHQRDGGFQCPLCAKHYCLSCRAPFHKNMTCEEF